MAEIHSHSTGLTVELDDASGLPVRIGDTPVRFAVRLETGGEERRGAYGGLRIDGAEVHDTSQLVEVTTPADGADAATATTRLGGQVVEWTYAFRAEGPRLSIGIAIRNGGDGELLVRDLTVEIDLVASAAATVHAPGNRLRAGLGLSELSGPVPVNTAGGTPGSTGLVALSDEAGSQVVWPISRDAVGATTIAPAPGGLRVTVRTGLAAAVPQGGVARYDALLIDPTSRPWPLLRDEIPGWYPALGIRLPEDSPEWTSHASMFEVQLGVSRFGGAADYSPYPTVRALIDDLPRIRAIGFDTLQIMPRQPFPSYNVVDWFDIGTSYGPEDDLVELVRKAHEHGLRVILDVLMHGVLDREFLEIAVDAVRNGPHGEFLRTTPFYGPADTARLPHAEQIPWSRHILDFARDWHDGSAEVHPLTESHPEWFYRDSAGAITGVYTKAFELSDPGWQDYFLAALRNLIDRLGIDGFRFDAPTYNAFPNWSERTRARASASELACLALFRRLREDLRPAHPDLMFYTEPSGVLLRESMDLVYNYDEHAQLEDVMGFTGVALGGGGGASHDGIRTAEDLAAWFDERNAVLPTGSVTAHHIDSHDTFWWPQPGQKWRREQFGVAPTRALASIFALSGGPYMTFVGGEAGIEEHLHAIHALRRLPAFAVGRADFRTARTDDPHVFAVVREHAGEAFLVLVNLADRATLVRPRGAFRVTGTSDVLPGEGAESDGEVRISPYGTVVLGIARTGEGSPA